MSGRCMPVAGATAEPPAGPRLFFVYWRSQRRQFLRVGRRVSHKQRSG